MITLQVRQLSHRYGERQVLDNVSFQVPAGVVFGLLGPNGAGKTTLMRCLFGVVAPDVGTFSFEGAPVTQSVRAGWGYMPQERGLYTSMKVTDHLIWLARLHDVSTERASSNAANLLERLGLADRADDKIKDLSGGMQQRVQLAAALVHEPDLLVLDEPFAGLDPTAVDFLSDVIVDHVRRGNSLVFSSHQLDLVESLCESLVMIDHGNIVLEGELVALKRQNPNRYLRLDVELKPDEISPSLGQLSETSPTGSRVRLMPGTDALDLLDYLRQHHSINDFGVEAPSLSEMFRGALHQADHTVSGNGTAVSS